MSVLGCQGLEEANVKVSTLTSGKVEFEYHQMALTSIKIQFD